MGLFVLHTECKQCVVVVFSVCVEVFALFFRKTVVKMASFSSSRQISVLSSNLCLSCTCPCWLAAFALFHPYGHAFVGLLALVVALFLLLLRSFVSFLFFTINKINAENQRQKRLGGFLFPNTHPPSIILLDRALTPPPSSIEEARET